MLKRYCNKCGKQLHSKKEYRTVNMRVYGLIMLGGEWQLDFCEDCFKEVIGVDLYESFIKKENEHKQRVEERKKSRLKNES